MTFCLRWEEMQPSVSSRRGECTWQGLQELGEVPYEELTGGQPASCIWGGFVIVVGVFILPTHGQLLSCLKLCPGPTAALGAPAGPKALCEGCPKGLPSPHPLEWHLRRSARADLHAVRLCWE